MHWKKKLALVLLPLALVCLLCACRQSTPEEETADLPELTIGVDILEPFFYLDENGAYAGIDAEIATEACRRAGYTPRFLDIPWGARDAYLTDGTVDCLWTAFIQDGREDSYLWTDTYLNSELTAIVDQRCPDHTLKDFRAKAALRAGSRAEALFRNGSSPEAEIYACGTFAMAETAFIKGYAGALAGHKIVLEQVMAEVPGQYRFLSDETMPVHLGVAFEKAARNERYAALNAALRSMKADGTLEAVAEKYGLDMTGGEGGATDAAD